MGVIIPLSLHYQINGEAKHQNKVKQTNMKKILHTAKSNPIEVIVPTILVVTIITIILCFTVFSNGNYIAHF